MGLPFAAPKKVRIVPPSDAAATLDLCIVWRKGDLSPASTKFLESVWHVFPHGKPGHASAKTPARRTA